MSLDKLLFSHSAPVELWKALAAAQGEFTPAPKDTENTFFKSTYADLAAVVQMAAPVLSKHGICVIQAPSWDPEINDATLTTLVAHSSGQWLQWEMRLFVPKLDPQGQGSAITYGRRYAYCAGLGIVADKDDDGNAASRAIEREPVESEDDKRAKGDGWSIGVKGYLIAQDEVAAALKRLKSTGAFTDERAKSLWKEWNSGVPKTRAQHDDWWAANVEPFLMARDYPVVVHDADPSLTLGGSPRTFGEQESPETPSAAPEATQAPLSEPEAETRSRAPSARELEKAGVTEEDTAMAWSCANAWRDQGVLGQKLRERKVSQGGTPDERMNRLVAMLALEFCEARMADVVQALPLAAESAERED